MIQAKNVLAKIELDILQSATVKFQATVRMKLEWLLTH